MPVHLVNSHPHWSNIGLQVSFDSIPSAGKMLQEKEDHMRGLARCGTYF